MAEVMRYIRSGGLNISAILIVVLIITIGLIIFENIWLGMWTEDVRIDIELANKRADTRLGVYGGIVGISSK